MNQVRGFTAMSGEAWLRKYYKKKFKRERQSKFDSSYHCAIQRFWGSFGNCQEVVDKIALLRDFAVLKLPNPMQPKVVRDKFDRKRIRVPFKCICCGDIRKHRHHIIAVANGGPNRKKNIVPLCEWCHSQVHKWMAVPNFPEESMRETMARVEREA